MSTTRTSSIDSAIPAIVDWDAADAAARTELLRRPTQAVAAQTRSAVADVLDDVRGAATTNCAN